MKICAWKYISQELEFRLLDLCINGFVAYLQLENIYNCDKENITNYFREILFNRFLEETDIVGYLHKNDFSKKNIIGKLSVDQLVALPACYHYIQSKYFKYDHISFQSVFSTT